jgi:hypothetical protein
MAVGFGDLDCGGMHTCCWHTIHGSSDHISTRTHVCLLCCVCSCPWQSSLTSRHQLTTRRVSWLLCAVPGQGWMSGTMSKPTNLDKRCQPGTSTKTCRVCLATADPASCLKCQATASRLDSLAQCTTCANIKDKAARLACISCVAPQKGRPAAPCAACLAAYEPVEMIAPGRVQAAVEACFGCTTKVAPALRTQCPRCFEGWMLIPGRSQRCVACLQRSNSLGMAVQCSRGLQLGG